MATEANFTPVFGPNGAVLNAPSMTPEMRDKIKQSASPPRLKITSVLGLLLISTLVALAFFRAGDLHTLLKSSPWWSGFAAGAASLLAVGLIARACLGALARWELIGGRLASERRLNLPEWARWFLAVSDSAAYSGWTAFMVLTLLDLGNEMWGIRMIAGLIALGGAIAMAMLRWLADKRCWVWR